MKESSALKEVVVNVLGSVEIKAIAIAKVYVCVEQQGSSSWESTELVGPAALIYNPKERTSFIYVVKLDDNSIGLCQEIYEQFNYVASKDFFHTFEMDDCVAGLSFAHTSEASSFIQAVKASIPLPAKPLTESFIKSSNTESPTAAAYANKPAPPAKPSLPPRPAMPVPATPTVTPAPPVVTPPPKSEQPPPHAEEENSSQLAPPPAQAGAVPPKDASYGKTPKKRPSIFRKMVDSVANAISGNDIPEDFEVSDPRGFRHESHIGWDPERGFEIRNIPPEWRKLFAAAGIKKNELRDAETARFVMNVIGESVAGVGPPSKPSTATTATSAPAPPPPPAAPAPPPPPPPAGKGGPPPPPSAKVSHPPAGKPAPQAPAGGRNDLLKSIQMGKELKKVEASSLPDLKALNPGQSNDLVNTLASAMALRRGAMQAEAEEEEQNESENWSD